jgi:hypothetical protein
MNHGGQIVWLTDNQVLVHMLEDKFHFIEITDPESKMQCRQYMHQTMPKR